MINEETIMYAGKEREGQHVISIEKKMGKGLWTLLRKKDWKFLVVKSIM